ncbi:MAG: hypothetical protein H0W61_10910 [Bacteroidetes bacterium]|nr:hypothetical protein [Bacteroidota bacterium]
MKRGSRFLTGLAVAGVTFGALMAILGPGQFNKYGRHRSCSGYYYQHQCTTNATCEPESK